MKRSTPCMLLVLFLFASSCTTADPSFYRYSSSDRIPSSFTEGSATIGFQLKPEEPLDALSLRGERLLYKSSNNTRWQSVELTDITEIQVRRSTKSRKVLSGAFIGSSLGLGLGIIASRLLSDGDLSESNELGIYPAAGAFAGLVVGLSVTSVSDESWDTYIPQQQDNGNWRFVKQE